MTDKELDEAIEYFKPNGLSIWQGMKQYGNLYEAARAYAALPKMQKVDLVKKKYVDKENPNSSFLNYYYEGYNAAIDDIKSKYGDLYVEVK